MAKKEQKVYMPLIIGDWLKGTRGMRAEARGVYLNLLLYQWDNGFIPEAMEDLIFIDPEVVKVWDKIRSKFSAEKPGRLVNKKCQEVRTFFSKQRKNGQLGGRKKKNDNPNDNPNLIPNDNPKANLHNALAYELKKEQKGASKKFALILPFGSEEFVRLWDVWVEYRRDAKKPYHTFSNQQAALQKLTELSNGDETMAIGIIKNCMANNAINFFKDDKQTRNSSNPRTDNLAASAFDRFKQRQGNHNG